MKKLILTYYAVWYLAHKNSKHAKDFSNYWFPAFLQVTATGFTWLGTILVVLDGLYGVYPFLPKELYTPMLLGIPAISVYYIIFHKYGVSKNAKDEEFEYLELNRKKRIMAWFAYIASGLLLLLSLYLVY